MTQEVQHDWKAERGWSEGGQKPHIVFVLMDDLGHDDTGVYGNERAEKYTPVITALAKEGVVLGQHYVHYHCSPTRRSFLTGRSPLHCGERISYTATDDIDLRFTWISEKLQKAGYMSHWYGKGHTGYKSMNHMPIRRGFDGGSALYLEGGGYYFGTPHWRGENYHTTNATTYSTDFFSSLALDALTAHDPTVPLFMYLPFQAPHNPYNLPLDVPAEECVGNEIACMVRRADKWIGRLVRLLREKDMYHRTLIVFSADNGGRFMGNNFPLRGEKQTSYQGAFQAAAFVSGGFLPAAVRGTTNNHVFHIMDWYPTLCRLAGVDGSDDPEVLPLEVDLARPDQDIYQGNLSFPPVDGVDIWDRLLHADANNPRASLWLSSEAMLRGRYKLVVAPPALDLVESEGWGLQGWRSRDGTWVSAEPGEWQCQSRDFFRPCLFDLHADPREQTDLAQAMPGLVTDMWTELNRSNMGRFGSRSPDALLGPCDLQACEEHWASLGTTGPICAVTACSR